VARELPTEDRPLRTVDAAEGEDGALPQTTGATGVAAPEEMPRVRFTRGRLLASAVFVISTVAFLGSPDVSVGISPR